MKYLLGFVLIMAAIFGLLWMGGAFEMTDPKEQAQTMRDQVKPGMSWEKVVEIHEPRKFYTTSIESGFEQEQDFNPQLIGDRVAQGLFPNGFHFRFAFTTKDNVEVYFDDKGKVTGLGKGMTTGDLYDMINSGN